MEGRGPWTRGGSRTRVGGLPLQSGEKELGERWRAFSTDEHDSAWRRMQRSRRRPRRRRERRQIPISESDHVTLIIPSWNASVMVA